MAYYYNIILYYILKEKIINYSQMSMEKSLQWTGIFKKPNWCFTSKIKDYMEVYLKFQV